MLEQYGIAVPKGKLARTAEQAGKAAADLGGRAVVKGQVLTGGRGKAGAIKVVSSQAEAESAAKQILDMSVKGFSVEQVLVTERLDIKAEYYAAITVDRRAKSAILILSAAGGMDIEEIAQREPEKIRRFTMSAGNDETLRKWLAESFEDDGLLDQASQIAQNMYRLFREKDCSLVEINPLAVTAQGRLIAADAKIVFDDSGVPQHPELAELRNAEEYTADEIEARRRALVSSVFPARSAVWSTAPALRWRRWTASSSPEEGPPTSWTWAAARVRRRYSTRCGSCCETNN